MQVVNKRKDICESCGSETVYNHKAGNIVCTSCGVLKESRFVDLSSEYRYFSDNSSSRADPRRVGNSVNVHMDSQIDLIEIGDYKKSYLTYSLQSNSDKAYTRALKTIKKYCDYLDIHSISKSAEDIYFAVRDKKELKGKKLGTIVAAIVYLACKKAKIDLRPQSFEAVADAPAKQILKACKVILKFIPSIKTHSYEHVKQISNKLKLDKEEAEKMQLVCKEIENWDVFESQLPRPRTIAATVIYLFSQKYPDKITVSLQDIKDKANISSDHTIKKYCGMVNTKFDKLIEKAFSRDDAKNLKIKKGAGQV